MDSSSTVAFGGGDPGSVGGVTKALSVVLLLMLIIVDGVR